MLNNWIEILGTVCGIVYLYQEFHASIYMWVTGIIMPAISLYVYYETGLYADFGINIYYLLAAIYGFCVWKFGKKKGEVERPITHTPRQRYLPLILTFIICFIAIGFILQAYTDSTVPWWDSFTTALSVVGMWMLARKWVEQWWTWVVVDAVSTGLYIYKGIYFFAALYGFYAIIAFYGYFKWKKLMNTSLSMQS
ncbi:MAG: nicotinamide mononucleotide transporter [Bacteroidaceae bacterium]|nr:nicotinamide mononucleotide transporter [Bacteroidaceae bacterium]